MFLDFPWCSVCPERQVTSRSFWKINPRCIERWLAPCKSQAREPIIKENKYLTQSASSILSSYPEPVHEFKKMIYTDQRLGLPFTSHYTLYSLLPKICTILLHLIHVLACPSLSCLDRFVPMKPRIFPCVFSNTVQSDCEAEKLYY